MQSSTRNALEVFGERNVHTTTLSNNTTTNNLCRTRYLQRLNLGALLCMFLVCLRHQKLHIVTRLEQLSDHWRGEKARGTDNKRLRGVKATIS